MTWNDAAERILRTEKKPLHYKDLADRILQKKLVETKGKTPHFTVHASISIENKARREKGLTPRFNLERGMVSLTAWEQRGARPPIFQQAEVQRQKVKEQFLSRLRQLSGTEFESYVEGLLIKMGYENVELRGGPGDEGIDLFCQMSQGINQVKTAVQAKCKQPNKRVGPNAVRLLREVLPNFGCSQGVLITTSGFTQQARDAANEPGKFPMILIDGDRLAELALEHEVGVRSREIKTYVLDDEFELFTRKKGRKEK